MGGYDSTNNVKNDIWRSTDEGTTWTEVSASAGWSARDVHSSVVSTGWEHRPDGRVRQTPFSAVISRMMSGGQPMRVRHGRR